jgi:hypothetical protein
MLRVFRNLRVKAIADERVSTDEGRAQRRPPSWHLGLELGLIC